MEEDRGWWSEDKSVPYFQQESAVTRPFRHAARYGLFKAIQIVVFALLFGTFAGLGSAALVRFALIAGGFFVLLFGTVGLVRAKRADLMARRQR
jgi:hypothetical protein